MDKKLIQIKLNFEMISKISKHLFNLPSKFYYGTTPQMMHDLSAAFLLDESRRTRKRTKTICTIGYFSVVIKTQDLTSWYGSEIDRSRIERGPSQFLTRKPRRTSRPNDGCPISSPKPTQPSRFNPSWYQRPINQNRKPHRRKANLPPKGPRTWA